MSGNQPIVGRFQSIGRKRREVDQSDRDTNTRDPSKNNGRMLRSICNLASAFLGILDGGERRSIGGSWLHWIGSNHFCPGYGLACILGFCYRGRIFNTLLWDDVLGDA